MCYLLHLYLIAQKLSVQFSASDQKNHQRATQIHLCILPAISEIYMHIQGRTEPIQLQAHTSAGTG